MRSLSALVCAALAHVASGSNAAGVAFLEANKKKEGVITLPSGLQYKVLRAGHGAYHPKADSSCSCHYEGRVAQSWPNGETFDSSYARGSPTQFAPNQVIKGWTEAMQLMVEGDKWEMYIPSELGYGESGSPPKIGGGDVLVFTMEIIEIHGGKVAANKCDVKTLEGCNEKESEYVAKKKELGVSAINDELKRLDGMASKAMSTDKRAWLSKRQILLRNLVKLKEEL